MLDGDVAGSEQLFIRNVGSPISRFNAEQLFVFEMVGHSPRKPASTLIRTFNYYPAYSLTNSATGDLYITWPTMHHLKIASLDELVQGADRWDDEPFIL
ncbi:hypothetical protein [Bradyrhizobium sp. ARR65]|uniref:hypothetical protein n=1 Tax=Bradyrhizobium sp. ARR65 TaxID=1040989 RepID=UPI0012FAC3F1|nr:hypothetical protein [Bradyrhizobium sp. ARR65]